MKNIQEVIQRQRDFYNSGKTKDLNFRLAQLKKFRRALEANEAELEKAMRDDFGKCAFEVYTTEYSLVIGSIKEFERNLKRWIRTKTVPKSMATFHAKSRIVRDPYGVVLIMSPWNYPLQLTLVPLIGAMAGGNTTVVKPSRYVPSTVAVMKRIIEENFDEEYIAMFEGGRDVNTALLEQRYDYIFFTGGTTVGKIAMRSAAENLTPITLELGGKSPCIVDETADIKKAAKSICWGKFINAGQTCVAPDYVMVKSQMKQALLDEMKKVVREFYGEDPKQSPDFARIITDRHFERVKSLIDRDKVFVGGDTDAKSRYIAPTILNNVSFDDAVMQEEIFGPLLPVIEYDDENGMMNLLVSFETPLAMYLFSKDRRKIDTYLRRLPSGDAVVNDTVIHVANPHLPFGGKGNSGMGSYHGKHSLDTFTQKRSVVYRNLMLDLPRYAPYEKKLGLIKKMM